MDSESKIYIAGHRGLVGSAIVKNLQSKGYKNLVLKTHSALDLTNQNAVARFFKSEKPEYVILAAAKVGGIASNNKYRAEFIYQNLMIQNNVIHEAYLNDVKKLLFLGSTCIYPKKSIQPIKEEYLLKSSLEYTNEPYAIAKIAGIKMCESYNVQYGTNFISAMPTNLYGPNDNFDLQDSHVLPALIRKIHLAKCLANKDWDAIKLDLDRHPIKDVEAKLSISNIARVLAKYGIQSNNVQIWGTGKPKREFLWSEDMADACVFLLENVDFSTLARNKKEIKNTHINIGTGEDISIRSLAHCIKLVVGFNGDLIYDTTKPDGTMRKLTEVSKIHDLGWKHKININKGLEMMYTSYLA